MTNTDKTVLAAAEAFAIEQMMRHGLGRWRFEYDNAKRRAGSTKC